MRFSPVLVIALLATAAVSFAVEVDEITSIPSIVTVEAAGTSPAHEVIVTVEPTPVPEVDVIVAAAASSLDKSDIKKGQLSLLRDAMAEVLPYLPDTLSTITFVYLTFFLAIAAGFYSALGAASGATGAAIVHPNNAALIHEAAGMGAYAAPVDFCIQLGITLFLTFAGAGSCAAYDNDLCAAGAVLGSYAGTFVAPVASTATIAHLSGADQQIVANAALAGLAIGSVNVGSKLIYDFAALLSSDSDGKKKSSLISQIWKIGTSVCAGSAAAAVLQASTGAGAGMGVFGVSTVVGLLPVITAKGN